jgi:hypothetical protein
MCLPKLYFLVILLCASFSLLPAAFAIQPASYAFLVTGKLNGPATNASQSLAIIGSIRLDGKGIGGGYETINSPFGVVQNESITAVYTDHYNGTIDLVLQTASGQTQSFSVDQYGDLVYTGPGAVAFGSLRFQDPYAAHTELSGIYGIGLSGETACLKLCAYSGHGGGAISASAVLAINQRSNPNSQYNVTGTLDATVASTMVSNQPVTGDYFSTSGVFGLSFSVPDEAVDLPRNFAIVPIDSSSFLMMSVDPHTTSALVTGGGSLHR